MASLVLMPSLPPSVVMPCPCYSQATEQLHKNYPYCATTSPAKAYCNAKYRKEHYGLSIVQTVECNQCLEDMQEYIRLFPNGIFPEGSPDTPDKYTSVGTVSIPGPMESAVGVPLFATQRAANAEGYLTNDGRFVVKKGSLITPKGPTSTCPQSAKNRLLVEASNLSGNKVLTDLAFSSASSAACFVTQASVNGNDVWKSTNGTKLIDLVDFFGSSFADKPHFSPAPSEVTGIVSETGGDSSDTVASTPNDDSDVEAKADVVVSSDTSITILHCKGRGANAKGYIRNDGKFVVLADSFITPLDFTTACPSGARKRHIAEQDKILGNLLKENLEFNSPSAAANFVLKSMVNGNDAWLTEDGVKLGMLTKGT